MSVVRNRAWSAMILLLVMVGAVFCAASAADESER